MKRGLGKRSKSARTHIESLENRQLLSAALSVGAARFVFNAVQKSSVSQTQSVILTDTGDAPLTLGKNAFSIVDDPSIATNDVARFTLLNAASAPATLGVGQNFTLQFNYNAVAVGLNSAFVDIATNDAQNPTQVLSLRGIGTAGLGGSNQPSLATILRAYDIPTIVGEGKNDANAAIDSIYPNPPDASSQEVSLQRLVKAGAGPVTIQTLASFTAAGIKPYTLGTYAPGNPGKLNELFFTPTTEYQSTYVQPEGATSFDPGSSQFGFYFISNVQVKGRVGYSEDALNTWDTTNNRKFRFFPLENPDGSVVPNAYIMTTTEWNAPIGYDFTNIVAIVRNVKAASGAPTGPALSLVNPNALPGSNALVFSRIQSPNTSVGDVEHDTGTLQVSNSGTSPLIVSSYTLSSAWELVNPPTFPLSIAAGATVTLSIKFDATSEPTVPYNETNSPAYPNGGGVYTGTLVLNTNDPNHAAATESLAGWWQLHSENSNEPSLQSITNLLEGWTTNINSTPIPELTESSSTTNSTPTYYGEEVVSPYWMEADPSLSVTVQQLAAYHTEGNTTVTNWYAKGSSTINKLYSTAMDDGQTLFPYAINTTTPASTTFTTTSAFGFKIDGEYSDDSKNTALKTGGGHHVRFYPVRNASGNLVPNTYIMTMDYSNTPQNFDFQDNVYIVSNMRPATGTAAPTDLYAVGGQGGNSLQWAPVTDSTLKGYNVYRSLSANGTYALLTSTPIGNASFFDSTAPSGTTSFYRVTAVDNSATESLGIGASAVASGTTPVTPSAPAKLVATGIAGAVSLAWSAVSDPTLQGYNVYRSTSVTGTFTLLTASPITSTSYTDPAATVGQTEFYKVTAVDAGSGLESSASTANATAQATTGLISADIGASIPGSTTVVTPGTDFNITAGGPGVANNADGFRFIYQSQTGDFDVKVQVASLTVAGNYSTAGIMARSTLDPTSPDVYMSASPVNYRFKERGTVGGVNNIVVGSATTYPNVWVRLSRVSNLFTGYTSTDGIHWTQVSSITLALPTTLSLGLAVASNDTTDAATAQLRDYSNTTVVTTPIAPPAPTNFTATGVTSAIDLAWTGVSDSTLKGYNVYRSSSSAGTYSLLNSSPITATSFIDSTVTAGVTMFYQVTAVDASSGLESTSATASATALAVASTGLQSVDIGASIAGSTAVITPGTDFNITAGGPGVANNADGFRFVYQPQTGDFDVKVQVVSLTVAGNYSTAGIMARSTLDTTSPDVYMSASPANYRFKERGTVGGVNNIVVGSAITYPNVWVRLSRVGNLFTGYSSTDGVHWTQVSSITLALPTTLSLGLAVASNDSTDTTTAQLRGYGNTAVVTTPIAPAAPTTLTATGATGAIALSWSAVADNSLKGYNVYTSGSATGTYTLLTSTPITATTYNFAPATAGVTVFFRVTAVDASSGLESAPASASGAASAPVSQPLTSIDIGATPGGSTSVSNDTYTVVAGGPGVTANSDGFRYLYTAQTGNFDVKVQINSITVAGNFSTAGIMARASLDATAANVYMSATPVNYRFKDRTTAAGTTNIVASGTPSYPNVWVRLQRVGNIFNGYNSADGVNWTLISSVTVALPATMDLGLAVASNVTTATTTAVLQNYGNT